MEGLHEIPRPEWATRYAAELVRRGAPHSLKELVAEGLRLWLTAGRQSPEHVALLHWRTVARSPELTVGERVPEASSTPPPSIPTASDEGGLAN